MPRRDLGLFHFVFICAHLRDLRETILRKLKVKSTTELIAAFLDLSLCPGTFLSRRARR